MGEDRAADVRHEVDSKRINQWLASLAVTVVCCAMFFLFFANYFLRIQEKLVEVQVRSEISESRIRALETTILVEARQRNTVPPAQAVAPLVPQQMPSLTTTPAAPPTLIMPQAAVPQSPAPLVQPASPVPMPEPEESAIMLEKVPMLDTQANMPPPTPVTEGAGEPKKKQGQKH